MITIVYTFKTRVYDEVLLENEPDPMSSGTGVRLNSQRSYVSIIGVLPIVAKRAVAVAHSLADEQPIPVALWSEKMKAEADRLLAKTGSWWRYGWFLPLFFAALALLAAWGVTQGIASRNLEEQQAAFIAAPRVGDIIIARDREDPDNYQSEFRTAYAISRLDDEYIYARRSSEKGPGHWLKLADRPRAAKKFNLSDGSFTGEEERFSRSMFKHRSGLHTLQDVSVPHNQRRYGMSIDLVLRPVE